MCSTDTRWQGDLGRLNSGVGSLDTMTADEDMPDANGEHDQVPGILAPPTTMPPPSGPPTGQ